MENVTAAAVVAKVWKDVRPLFYLEPPSTSRFEDVSEVPDYLKKDQRETHAHVVYRLLTTGVTPYFFVLVFVEVIVRWLQGKTSVRLNDSINSMTAGLFLVLSKILIGAFEISTYVWVYRHCCLLPLPWDSPLTWWLSFLAVDCGYYWFHRMAHEVNLAWAAHQAHHSSEDYTLSTALRQSPFQRFSSWVVYLPLALFLPPTAYMAHKQFNLLYQFWIHTEVVDRLGPLEWVLNTPSHHRVHHGRNPYCIDCNYAGVLIIWDRMFGTFQAERKEEKVIYGLVHPLATWDPLWAQVHHYIYLWRRLWGGGEEGTGVTYRLSLLLKGPGWSPGKPRLGCRDDIPQVPPDEKPYDRPVPGWLSVYIVLHFVVVMVMSFKLGNLHSLLHPILNLFFIFFLILSLTNFGLMFDGNHRCVSLEVLRLVVLLITDLILTLTPLAILSVPPLSLPAKLILRSLVVGSIGLWSVKLLPLPLPLPLPSPPPSPDKRD